MEIVADFCLYVVETENNEPIIFLMSTSTNPFPCHLQHSSTLPEKVKTLIQPEVSD